MPKEFVEVGKANNRQAQIEKADIGDVVSLGRRVDLSFGLPDGLIAKHTETLRNTLDTQVHRARKKHPERRYTVENGHFLTRSGALMIVASCTRIQ